MLCLGTLTIADLRNDGSIAGLRLSVAVEAGSVVSNSKAGNSQDGKDGGAHVDVLSVVDRD